MLTPACNVSITSFFGDPYYLLILAQVIIEASAEATVPVPRGIALPGFGPHALKKIEVGSLPQYPVKLL